jgi:hypothetical protein
VIAKRNYSHLGVLRRPKRVHRPRGSVSLAAECLADGTLDVDLLTGEVMSYASGSWKKRKTRLDDDGYVTFTLSRDVNGRRKRKSDAAGRWRLHMTVLVHRLVMMKKVAIACGEARWRSHVEDLPSHKDVHHRDRNRAHNEATNLTLEPILLNRGGHLPLEGF